MADNHFSLTVHSITILPKSGKTAKKQTIGGIEIQKFISFGGGGSFTELAIKFTTAKKANITVYYGSTSADRYVALFTSSNKTLSTTPTTTDGEIKSFTLNNRKLAPIVLPLVVVLSIFI